MNPIPLIIRLEEEGVTLADISALPRMLALPPGVARRLRCEGVLRRVGREKKKSVVVWGAGPEYTAFVSTWKASKHKAF
jgi:hypothetical protein